MEYIYLDKKEEEHVIKFQELMIEYFKELDEHENNSTPKEIVDKYALSMISKLDENRILKIVKDNETFVGFCYAKIDKETDKGLVYPGWGYIMEFFVRKEYRRKSIGKQLLKECENFFVSKGAKNAWLTSDEFTGIPFWEACDYKDSNEVSSENNLKIFVKQL